MAQRPKPARNLAKTYPQGLPTREQIMEYIQDSREPADKRAIAKAFGIRGNEKIALKKLLRDMADEGLIEAGESRSFHKMGGVPKVTVLRVIEADGKNIAGVPDRWEADGIPPPKIRIFEQQGRGALAIGDKVLARTEEAGSGYRAFVMKKLQRTEEQVLGVLEKDRNDRFWLKPVEKSVRRDWAVSDPGEAQPGQLVMAEVQGRAGQVKARVTEVLGEPLAPKSFSLIAIHKYGIPCHMPAEAEAQAKAVCDLPLTPDGREDLRNLPIVAIDPRDARDFDDAIWAAPDDDPKNEGGFKAIIAIADVSYYVRPGSALDKEARKRGNSVYFPDQVVPMLPHALSSDKCSLKAGEDRAALACHIQIGKNGEIKSWRFARALLNLAANIPYEDAQAAIDGALEHEMTGAALRPLWEAWGALSKGRHARAPLELDLPERQIQLDDQGKIIAVKLRERLDAHRVVEDFMIAANVAAAKALESKKASLVYRVHEAPAREKLVGLQEYLKTLDIKFTLGQLVIPAMFNRLIAQVDDEYILPQVMEQILRTQTQAYYTPDNAGHFGLALGSYAHFTSPIRRYADLIVHRALVSSFHLEIKLGQLGSALSDLPHKSGMPQWDIENLEKISEAISDTERRAMKAERDTTDRYVAAYLSGFVGQIVKTRITGVQNFGFFATVEGLGGDGLVPVSHLGDDYYRYDESAKALVGEHSGKRYETGQRIELRLAEADPVSGSLRFELVAEDGDTSGGFTSKRQSAKERIIKKSMGARGRPANIRHKGKPRRK